MIKKNIIILLAAVLLFTACVTACEADDFSEYTSLPAPVTSRGGDTLPSVYLTTPPISVSVPDVTTVQSTVTTTVAAVSHTTNILDLFAPVPIDEYYSSATSGAVFTEQEFTESALPSPDPGNVIATAGDTSPVTGNELYYAYDYRGLTAAQKSLYSFFVNNVPALPDSLTVTDLRVTADDYQIVYNLILQYDPRFFFLGDEIRAAHYQGDEFLTTITPDYNDTKSAITSAAEKIDTAAEKLVSQSSGLGEFDKAVFFYDSIIKSSVYQLEGDAARTVYGTFINGAAQCQGLSKAYKYLCNKAGLECYLVNGYNAAGEAHMWNIVRINGNWYHIDLTKGDSNSDFEKYNYCLIDDAHLYKNYTRDYRSTPLPSAVSMADNWYVRKGLYAKTADEAILILKRAVLTGSANRDGCIEIMVDDPAEYKIFADRITSPDDPDALNRIYDQVNITSDNKISTEPCYFSRYDADLVFIIFPKYE
jgi:hypothetical protein